MVRSVHQVIDIDVHILFKPTQRLGSSLVYGHASSLGAIICGVSHKFAYQAITSRGPCLKEGLMHPAMIRSPSF